MSIKKLGSAQNVSFEKAPQTNKNKQETVNLDSPQDKVEISDKKGSTAKKIALGAALWTLGSAAAILIYSIGRNPSKAAKVLKGNSEIFEPAFKDGKNFVDKLFNKSSSVWRDFDDVLSVFKTSQNKSASNISSKIEAGITECPKDILPKNGIFYHGTVKPGKVYKNGFTPYASNQLESASRELGTGIYVTPDVKVAANFSGITGAIIPVKISPDAKIAYVSEKAYSDFSNKLLTFLREHITKAEYDALTKTQQNAVIETLYHKAFQMAGYDAAYCPKAVKGGGNFIQNLFTPDVNKLLGRNQSQLVVFSPEKLEIASRSFKERVLDLKDKFSALSQQMKYAKEHPLGF